MFTMNKWEVEHYDKALGAKRVIEQGLEYDIALIDVTRQLENEDGIEIVCLSKRLHPTIPVVTICSKYCQHTVNGQESVHMCDDVRAWYKKAEDTKQEHSDWKLNCCPCVQANALQIYTPQADAHFLEGYNRGELLKTLDDLLHPDVVIQPPEKQPEPEPPALPGPFIDGPEQPPASE
jgi:hypothetical protein